MALYLKHRPQNFDDIIGNESVIDSLQSCLSKKDHPHSLMFYGPTGCGKTTLGRIVANELGCKGSDFREIDSADFRGIDTIREIRKQAQFRPLEGSCKVWLLDEVHKLSNDAMNAMLKALEDTPPHVYYILCTTDPQKLISTIKGRCSQFQVNQLGEKEMMKLLRRVVKAEDEKLEKKVYEQIAQDSQGHPRNALQILDQVLGVEPEKRLEIAKKSAEVQSQSIELCRALLQGAGWKKISNILSGLKDQEPETIRRQVLGYCSSVLLKEENMQAAAIMEEFTEPFFNTNFPGLVLACFSVVCGNQEEE
jgi:DNA polymerase-3 subunit gamma/tau